MAALVLRWQAVEPALRLRWRVQDRTQFAQQPAPPRTIATIIGPPGPAGDPGPPGGAILPPVIRGGSF